MTRETAKMKSIIWFFLFLIGINELTYYFLVDDAGIPSRYILHNFYDREENIDTLFLGSSHTMYGIDPEIYEEITGNKAYNCGTNWQYLDGSFALLREADRLYELKHVYVDLYFYLCASVNRKERTSAGLGAAYNISDYMRPSWNKYLYLFSCSNASHYVEGMIPQRRYVKNLTEFSYIKGVVSKKKNEAYKNYIYEQGGERIEKNGRTVCSTSLKDVGFYYEGVYDPLYERNDDWNGWKEVIMEMIDYCDQHGITLTFMALPMSDFYIMQAGGIEYDRFIEEVREIVALSKSNVGYIDFNLSKELCLNLSENDYRDISHLNSEGAAKTTELLSKLESDNDKEHFFFNSYSEKIAAKDEVYGATLTVDREKNLITVFPVSNMDAGEITYEITCKDGAIGEGGGEMITFQYEPGEEYVIRFYVDDKQCARIRYTGK